MNLNNLKNMKKICSASGSCSRGILRCFKLVKALSCITEVEFFDDETCVFQTSERVTDSTRRKTGLNYDVFVSQARCCIKQAENACAGLGERVSLHNNKSTFHNINFVLFVRFETNNIPFLRMPVRNRTNKNVKPELHKMTQCGGFLC